MSIAMIIEMLNEKLEIREEIFVVQLKLKMQIEGIAWILGRDFILHQGIDFHAAHNCCLV